MMTMEGNFCFAVFFALLYVVESTEQPCAIHGLPRLPRHGDVTVLHVTEGDTVRLSCRCPTYAPQWQVVMAETNTTVVEPLSVHCLDNGEPCDNSFILPESQAPNKFTYSVLNLNLTQTTLLQCYAQLFPTRERDSVLVVVVKNDQLPHPTLSSTPATVYSTPTMLCDENTVTLTVCPTPSNSINKPVGVSSTQLQLSANTPSPLPTQMVEITNPNPVADTFIENIGGTPGLASMSAVLVLVVVVIALVITIVALKIKHNKKLENRDHTEEDDHSTDNGHSSQESIALEISTSRPTSLSPCIVEEYSQSPSLLVRSAHISPPPPHLSVGSSVSNNAPLDSR